MLTKVDVQNVFLCIFINKASVFCASCTAWLERSLAYERGGVGRHFQFVLKVIRLVNGINYNTDLLPFSGRNTCKALKDPWRKGKRAMDGIFRMDVDNTVRAL